MKHLGDITKISGYDIPIVDCICGGSPCQDLSVAGKRAGLAGERSGLFMEQVRIVREMRENDRRKNNRKSNQSIRPRFMVWENVPGALSSGEPAGEDFRIVLEEIARIVDHDAVIPRPSNRWSNAGLIVGNGWSIAWRIHDAQFWGVAQRRRRISLVADFGSESVGAILFERKGMSRDIEKSATKREAVAETIEKCVNSTNYTLKIRGGREVDNKGNKAGKGALIQTEKSGTLGVSQDQTLIQVLNDEGGGVSKCFGLDHVMLSGGTTYEGHGYYFDKSRCLKTQPHGVASIAFNINVFKENTASDSGVSESEISKTLDLQGGNPNCNQGGTAIVYQDVIGAIGTRVGTITNQTLDQKQLLINSSIVRRLTPLECERLQGFPDEWTNIGAWTDTKGKLHKESTDAARYKALGNSIAVGYTNEQKGFWMWLMNRISKQYDRLATLGSLFDGIGGFPLAWEFYNGKGSAIWASEIEEFPIAVTKYHFPEGSEIDV